MIGGGGGPNHKSQAMTSLEIFERGTFCGTKILQIRRSEAVASVLAYNQEFAIGRELTPPKKSVNWDA